jgi:hypothetical protein
MDTRLQALAGSLGGAFSALQAYAVGVSDAELLAATRSRDVVRVRRGAFVSGALWWAADDDERFRLRVIAIARSRPGDALSHHAALAVHGLALFGHDPARIDLITRSRRGSSRNGLHLHPSAGCDVISVDGVPTVSIARAVVRAALTMGVECAVVAGDAALNSKRVTLDELLAEVARLSPHEGRVRAHECVLRMDGKAQSPGESRTRLIVQDLGLEYDSQVELRDGAGQLVGIVDLLVEGVAVEFDGRLKYRADQADPDDPDAVGRIVWAEKRREDDIRRQGHPVERVVWSELDRPGLIGKRIRDARRLVTARPRGVPERWSAGPTPA